MSWHDNALRLVRRKRNLPRESAGAGLLLIPSTFTGPGLRTRVRLPEPPQLAYPARGVGTLWETRSVIGACVLTSVLGRSRTPLLTELQAPASTAHGSGLGVHRYVVEGTIGLLHWFRRLRIRWETRDDIHKAFMTLAPATICWRDLVR
ncbi:hypothetical protein [Microtetraspora fusca]|uniref:hypothetical protein n=1 Tax=Microtetraspora fusca TaxID=1997 RepID=UPI000835EE74